MHSVPSKQTPRAILRARSTAHWLNGVAWVGVVVSLVGWIGNALDSGYFIAASVYLVLALLSSAVGAWASSHITAQ